MGQVRRRQKAETPEPAGKDGLVITFDLGSDPTAASPGDGHIDPRENLAVAARAAAEALRSQILQGSILGVIVAALTLIGVDEAWDKRYATRKDGLFRAGPEAA